MFELDKRKNIDLLVEQFWRQGYLTLSRKFGRYLPEPEKIGNFDIDVVARCKKDYAIGITVSEEDLKDSRFLEKVSFLATRQTRFSKNNVLLFIGVPAELLRKTEVLLESIDQETKKNIRVVRVNVKTTLINDKGVRNSHLFS